MSEYRSVRSLVGSVCLVQFCFALPESLLLAIPSMYALAYLLGDGSSGMPFFHWMFVALFVGLIALPAVATVQAWFLLRHGRSSGWYVSIAVDTGLALAYAGLMIALRVSPPIPGPTPWTLLSVFMILPLVHLAVIALPIVRRSLVM